MTMKRLITRRFLHSSLAMLPLALLFASGCVSYTPEKGLIVRFDGGLEINRVPHVQQHNKNVISEGRDPRLGGGPPAQLQRGIMMPGLRCGPPGPVCPPPGVRPMIISATSPPYPGAVPLNIPVPPAACAAGAAGATKPAATSQAKDAVDESSEKVPSIDLNSPMDDQPETTAKVETSATKGVTQEELPRTLPQPVNVGTPPASMPVPSASVPPMSAPTMTPPSATPTPPGEAFILPNGQTMYVEPISGTDKARIWMPVSSQSTAVQPTHLPSEEGNCVAPAGYGPQEERKHTDNLTLPGQSALKGRFHPVPTDNIFKSDAREEVADPPAPKASDRLIDRMTRQPLNTTVR